MTEAEWLQCLDPVRLLLFLQDLGHSRKLQRFACALCRLFWGQLLDARSRRAVETLERYADGRATEEELAAAREDARRAAWGSAAALEPESWGAAWVVLAAMDSPAEHVYCVAAREVPDVVRPQIAVALIRRMFGNPFRPATPTAPRPTRDLRSVAGQTAEGTRRTDLLQQTDSEGWEDGRLGM